jgi:hypothetical protein
VQMPIGAQNVRQRHRVHMVTLLARNRRPFRYRATANGLIG